MTRVRPAVVGFLGAMLTLLSGTAGCEHRDSGAAIPPVTAPPVNSASTPSTSGPTGTRPTAPSSGSPSPRAVSCRLLSDDDVRTALRRTTVPAPHGDVFRKTNGPGGVIVDYDLCSWQQDSGADPGVVVQAQLFRASSAVDGSRAYGAFVDQLVTEASFGRRPVDVPGLGRRAARLPEWVVVLHDADVLGITISAGSGGQEPDPQLLLRLARDATRQLGW